MLAAKDEAYINSILGRELTPLESAAFENLWSEHCSYRSTKKFLRTLPTTGDAVIVGPGDDAAIVQFSDDTFLALAMESHNHPSYINPYSGAATGVGGIARDVFSMGAQPIAILAPWYFGKIEEEKTQWLMRNATAGAADYANTINVPALSGYQMFDESFMGNPLINVVCLGKMKAGKFMFGKAFKIGSKLLLFGAATGRDGLGGAAFASGDIAKNAGDEGVKNTCVDGNPAVEADLIKATLELFERGLILSCRDLGAAGLGGASSEMCVNVGARIFADAVPLRDTNMNEVEIMLAESQERMIAEVKPEKVAEAEAVCKKYGLAYAIVGETTGSDQYVVEFNGKVVCELPIKLLTEGVVENDFPEKPYDAETPFTKPAGTISELVRKVLSHPDLADNSMHAAQFNSQAQGRTYCVTPFYSVLELDGMGLSAACGCNARHTYLNPYAGAANAVLELASHIVSVGGMPLCALDNLNFGSPEKPEVMWQISESTKGLGDMCRALAIPIVGGNVSLYNESDAYGTSIKPAPAVAMFGKGDLIGWEWPDNGDMIAVVGATKEELGGSVLDAVTGCGGAAPAVGDVKALPAIRELVEKAQVSGCMAITRGGLLYALVNLAAQAEVQLSGDAVTKLFSETYGRFLVTFSDEHFLKESGIPYEIIGKITESGKLTIRTDTEVVVLTQQDLFTAGSTITKACRAR
ncbi:phosphoribosylformylglycinamidine synthase subunit PurL [Methanorbis furvi]|uniref:Phosphoribosylformylglycinamidine synthase subunit PurL n=1 Tax=Methanorbis furvi TaxID=3028299 RepID=A0AAE4MCQ4_9EURY|nr:Phosphoribosylformylglycinamidine synthase subunit PurL [Methanocorpusculaceae archaeon Ag1]